MHSTYSCGRHVFALRSQACHVAWHDVITLYNVATSACHAAPDDLFPYCQNTFTPAGTSFIPQWLWEVEFSSIVFKTLKATMVIIS